jgi:DNA invertase Pin-like site-specific DNA recombinase
LLVGYARVSTLEQHLDLQLDALTHAGCEKIFRDTISGAKSERPGLSQAIEFMRQGDVLVVWKLDQLGRSLRDLIDIVSTLRHQGIGFRVLQEAIDTTTPAGELIFHIFGPLAEFERALIRLRTRRAGRGASSGQEGRKTQEVYSRAGTTDRGCHEQSRDDHGGTQEPVQGVRHHVAQNRGEASGGRCQLVADRQAQRA